ncbi:MAG: hypothetical protein JRE92_06410 [Deltaproteobacteria bacterium]|jgi:hypothetical protein|nr:hypothetical protein [Deltaproteobacteria bacterium]
MGITSQITVSIKSELSESLLKVNAFTPGSILNLKVLELRGDRALIDFGKFRATADIKVPVSLGEELRVKVLESGRQLKMSVISSESKNPLATELLAGHFKAPAADSLQKAQTDLKLILNQAMESQAGKSYPKFIINILNWLSYYFESFDLEKVVTKLIPQLKACLENAGVFFEKSLENSILKSLGSSEPETPKQLADLPEVKHIVDHDLKANLMALKSLIEDKAALQNFFTPRALATLHNSINSLLSDITHQQGRAVAQLDSAEPFQVFSFTLPLKEGAQTARLKVYFQKKQKSGANKGFRISLLLSLDRLGDLRTDFFLLDKDLTINFFVKEDSTKVKIQENFLELQELLHVFFNQIVLKVSVSEKKVIDFDHEDFQVNGDRQVDLRV